MSNLEKLDNQYHFRDKAEKILCSIKQNRQDDVFLNELYQFMSTLIECDSLYAGIIVFTNPFVKHCKYSTKTQYILQLGDIFVSIWYSIADPDQSPDVCNYIDNYKIIDDYSNLYKEYNILLSNILANLDIP